MWLPLAFRDPVCHFLVEQELDGLRFPVSGIPGERRRQELLGVEAVGHVEVLVGQSRFSNPAHGKLTDVGISAVDPEHVPFALQVGYVVGIDPGLLAFLGFRRLEGAIGDPDRLLTQQSPDDR